MLYIYDILVNFMDGERVYEFFEWDTRDIIEHIRKIPVIRVNEKAFYDLVYNQVVVDRDFLDLIKDKTYTYKEGVEYAVIISNLDRCYALEFNSKGEVVFRSSLLIDEEDEVIECSSKLDEFDVNYTLVRMIDRDSSNFTRKEEMDRNMLKRELITTYEGKNYEKLNYLYEEAYGNDSTLVDERYRKMLDDINGDFKALKKLVQIIYLTNKKRKAIQ